MNSLDLDFLRQKVLNSKKNKNNSNVRNEEIEEKEEGEISEREEGEITDDEQEYYNNREDLNSNLNKYNDYNNHYDKDNVNSNYIYNQTNSNEYNDNYINNKDSSNYYFDYNNDKSYSHPSYNPSSQPQQVNNIFQTDIPRSTPSSIQSVQIIPTNSLPSVQNVLLMNQSIQNPNHYNQMPPQITSNQMQSQMQSQILPNQIPPNQIPPNQISLNQIAPNQIQLNQIQPNQILPNQILPNQVPPNQVPPNQIPPNQISPNQIPPNQIPPNQISPNQIAPNPLPPNQILPNQIPPNQIPPSQITLQQIPPNQIPPTQIPLQMQSQIHSNQISLNSIPQNHIQANYIPPPPPQTPPPPIPLHQIPPPPPPQIQPQFQPQFQSQLQPQIQSQIQQITPVQNNTISNQSDPQNYQLNNALPIHNQSMQNDIPNSNNFPIIQNSQQTHIQFQSQNELNRIPKNIHINPKQFKNTHIFTNEISNNINFNHSINNFQENDDNIYDNYIISNINQNLNNNQINNNNNDNANSNDDNNEENKHSNNDNNDENNHNNKDNDNKNNHINNDNDSISDNISYNNEDELDQNNDNGLKENLESEITDLLYNMAKQGIEPEHLIYYKIPEELVSEYKNIKRDYDNNNNNNNDSNKNDNDNSDDGKLYDDNDDNGDDDGTINNTNTNDYKNIKSINELKSKNYNSRKHNYISKNNIDNNSNSIEMEEDDSDIYNSLYNEVEDNDSVMDMEIEDEEEKNSSIVLINKSNNLKQKKQLIYNIPKVEKKSLTEQKNSNKNTNIYKNKNITNNEEYRISSAENSSVNSPIINSYENSSVNSSKDLISDLENSLYSSIGYYKNNKYPNSSFSRYHYVRTDHVKNPTTKPFIPDTGPIKCIIELSDSDESSDDENITHSKHNDITPFKQLSLDKQKRLLILEKQKQEMMRKIATMESLKAKKNSKSNLSKKENNKSQKDKNDGVLKEKDDSNESIASSINSLKSDDEISSGISTPINGILNNNNNNDINSNNAKNNNSILKKLMDNNLESTDLKTLNKTLKKKELEIKILETDKKDLEIENEKLQSRLKDIEKITKDTKEKIDNYLNQIKICEKLLEKNQQLLQEFNNKSLEMKNKINLKSKLINTISSDVSKYKERILKLKENQDEKSLLDDNNKNDNNTIKSTNNDNSNDVDNKEINSSLIETNNKMVIEKNIDNSKLSPKKRTQEISTLDENAIKRKKINELLLFDKLIKIDKLPSSDIKESTKKQTFNINNKKTIQFLFKNGFSYKNVNDVLNTLKEIKHINNDKPMFSNIISIETSKISKTQIKINEISNRKFKPYKSILSGFRSSHYKNILKKKDDNIIDEKKINPFKALCMYETLGGQCKDSSCQAQHLRDIEISDDEYLCKLLKIYIINNNNINDLKMDLQNMRDNNEPVNKLISYLASKINEKDNLIFEGIGIKDENTNSTTNNDINKENDIEGKYYDNIKINNSVNLGLYSILEKERIKQDRYFNKEITPDEYEKLLSKNNNDIELWIKYAVSALPSEINKDNIGKLNTNLDKTLNILSRALDQNNDSSAIWNLYMDLYVQREDTDSIREIFEQLMFIIPKEPWCGWLFLSWEKIYQNKIIILKNMLFNFIKINGKKEHSHLILELLIYTIKLINEKKGNEEALKLFMKITYRQNKEASIDNIIDNNQPLNYEEIDITKTFIFEQLNLKDLLIWYLLFIHFYEYRDFPEEIFFSGNRNYLIHNELFTFNWGNSKPKEFDKYIKFFEELLNKWPVEEQIENNETYLALMINYIDLGKFLNSDDLNKKVTGIIEKKNDSIKEFVYSLLKECQYNQNMNTEELYNYLKSHPNNPSLWLKIIKYYINNNNDEKATLCFTESIKQYFNFNEDLNTMENNDLELKISINLYKKILGLPLPYDIALPSLKDEFSKNIRYLQNDIDIIFNYLIFISYNRNIEENLLQQTINDLTYNLLLNNSKFSIFMNYICKDNFNTINGKIDFIESFKNLKTNVEYHYLYEKNSESNYKFMHLTPSKDYTLFNIILDLYIDEFKEVDKTEIIEILYKKYPDNKNLILRQVKKLCETGQFKQAEKIIKYSLQLYPNMTYLNKFISNKK